MADLRALSILVLALAAACSKKWVTHDRVSVEGWEIETVEGTVPVAPNLERLTEEHPDLRRVIGIAGRIAGGPGERFFESAYVDPAYAGTFLHYSVAAREGSCAVWERVVSRKEASRDDQVRRRKLGGRTWIEWTQLQNGRATTLEYWICHEDVRRAVMVSQPAGLTPSARARLERTLARSRLTSEPRR